MLILNDELHILAEIQNCAYQKRNPLFYSFFYPSYFRIIEQ